MRNVLVLAFAVLVACSGCAARRTNTRELKEDVTAIYLEAPANQAVDQAVGLAEAGGIAIELGLAAAKALINLEAEKYVANSVAQTHATIPSDQSADPWNRPELKTGGVVVLLRTIYTKSASKDSDYVGGLEQLSDDVVEGLDNEIVKHVSDRGINLAGGRIAAEIKKRVRSREGYTRYLAFCGVLGLKPRTDAHSFEINLVGYQYNALKAKRLNFKVPFTKWDRTESVLSVVLEGPQGDLLQDYTATAAFKLNAKLVDKAEPRERWFWVPEERQRLMRNRSKPMAVSRSQDMFLGVSLAEASDLKAALNDLAEQVGKAKINLK